MKSGLQFFWVILFAVMASMPLFAANEKDEIEMVAYEQSWMDSNGTIALRNNTNDTVYSVTFTLKYLDMSGRQLDYSTYTRNVEIEPHMTKKVDVPAYESERHYHYYKTPDRLGNPSFKINYELQEYEYGNVEADVDAGEMMGLSVDSSRHDYRPLLAILIVLVIFGSYIGLFVLVAVMAQRRNQNPAFWLLLSFIATPFLICFILLFIHKTPRSY